MLTAVIFTIVIILAVVSIWRFIKWALYVATRDRVLALNKAGILTNIQTRVYLHELENPYDAHAVARVFEELKQYPLIINKEK